MDYSTDNIIKLAWSDRVSFEKIERLHGTNESEAVSTIITGAKIMLGTALELLTDK